MPFVYELSRPKDCLKERHEEPTQLHFVLCDNPPGPSLAREDLSDDRVPKVAASEQTDL